MNYLVRILFSIGVCGGIVACDQKSTTENTKQRATAEEDARKKVENDNLAKKAEQMEKDLAERHYFYSAIEGEYQGTVKVNKDLYSIKLNFTRSIPPYTGDRTRQLSEIENDLNNLFFNIQVVQWHPSDVATAVGCRVSGMKPNMINGSLIVTSSDCPNLYSIYLAEDFERALKDQKNEAKQIAEKLKQHQIQLVPLLTGTIQPSSHASQYSFTVKKMK